MSDALLGGWGNWNFTPSKDAQKIFAETLGTLTGVQYTLIAAKSQLVAGVNYRFICTAQDLFPGGSVTLAEVLVYQPLKGNALVRGMKKIGPIPTNNSGGWSDWTFPSSATSVAVLNEALDDFFGVKYKAHGSTFQVVAGKNYCFLCEETPTLAVPSIMAAFVYVSYLVGGKPMVTEIQPID